MVKQKVLVTGDVRGNLGVVARRVARLKVEACQAQSRGISGYLGDSRVLRFQVEAYQTAATGDHNPSREHWHAPPAAASSFSPARG